MSATAEAGGAHGLRLRFRWPHLTGPVVGDWTIATLIFLSGFVLFEPAPFDLLLCVVLVVWGYFGLRFNRHFMPLTVLLVLYCVGGFLAFTQIDDFAKPLVYHATTIFLCLSALFFAAVIVEAPERRLALIANAYIVVALVVSLIAILAYFDAIPGADLFKRYDRAKGTFQDPNVYGPFLILPLLLLARGILTSRLRDAKWKIVGFLIILLAILVSFSRAAWGMSLGTLVIVALLAFINERSRLARFRLVAYAIGGIMAVGMLLSVAISIPTVHQLFVERASIVQEYDEGRLGRFERHLLGFYLIQEKPLGIGPFVFGQTFGEDEHNMWLKGFTVYGWLGGFSYIILAIWTLAAATPLLFKPRPWQGIVQCAYAAFLGHLVIHFVIDNDHWRHLFLLYGLLWGAIAAEKMRWRRRDRLGTSVAPGRA